MYLAVLIVKKKKKTLIFLHPKDWSLTKATFRMGSPRAWSNSFPLKKKKVTDVCGFF